MKISAALIFASMASMVGAKTISGRNVAKALKNARRLDQAQGDDAQEDENAYLAQYNLKLIGCRSGETIVDPEDGEYEYSAAIVRLCPSESGCDSDTVTGCTEGHGDYMIGLNSFVQAYFEDQRDNMNWDDQFDVDRYAECAEYEMEVDDDGNNAPQYYIGPTCTSDGEDVKLAVFDDYTCTTKSESTFEEISNGWTLPYESGGIVSTNCIDCLDVNDNGEYELRDMCMQIKEKSAYSCETEMEYYSYYGKNEQGCEYVQEFLPATRGGNGGKVFGWFVFFLVVGGLAGYIIWWRKKKSANTDGLVA